MFDALPAQALFYYEQSVDCGFLAAWDTTPKSALGLGIRNAGKCPTFYSDQTILINNGSPGQQQV
jgi:hypothetical protein